MLRRSLLLAALTLVAQGALAKDWDSIRFATEGANPPFNMVDTQGEVQGFEVERGHCGTFRGSEPITGAVRRRGGRLLRVLRGMSTGGGGDGPSPPGD